MTALDGEITAGVHDSFVSVIEADNVRRMSFLTTNFNDHPVPVRGAYCPPTDDNPVALRCLHGNHLQPKSTTLRRAVTGGAWQDSDMPQRLLLIADTHVPKRARDLPGQVWAAVDNADVVFHAGDWVNTGLLAEFERRCCRLVAVYGNNDGPELRRRLPETVTVVLEGVRFSMVHETGTAKGRNERADTLFPDADVLVLGHSHIPWDTTSPLGLRLLNPGSPTDRRRQPACTYMTAVVDAGRLRQVELVEVRRD